MSALPSFLALNNAVTAAFADLTPAVYSPISGSPSSFPVPLCPLDPIRQEGVATGNFTMRFGNKADFDKYGVIPVKGDVLVTNDSFGTPTTFRVDQVQADSGGGYRFLLLRKAV